LTSFTKGVLNTPLVKDVNLALWVAVLFIIVIIQLVVLSGKPCVLVLSSPFGCHC